MVLKEWVPQSQHTTELVTIQSLYIATYTNLPKPNLIVHSIKGRASRFPKYIRVYQYVDLGTGRSQDLYVTTKDLQPITNIEKLKIYHN